MKVITLLILLIGLGITSFPQTKITWDDLKFKSTKKVWNEEFQAVYEKPRFAKKAKKLDSTKIIITGHFVPVDILSKYYILSASEFHSFCGNINQYDELIAVKIELDSNIRTNDVITLTGTLALNTDDILQLNYILEDAKIVEKEPIKITWEDLKLDSTSEVWNEEFQSKTPICHINNETKKLNGKKVQISGHFVPIDIEAQYFALTFEEVNSHSFFHGNIYPSHIIDLIISPQIIPNMNEKVTIIGTLVLNEDDFLKLNFILENAKIIADK